MSSRFDQLRHTTALVLHLAIVLTALHHRGMYADAPDWAG